MSSTTQEELEKFQTVDRIVAEAPARMRGNFGAV
jgi:hypothetical protein